MDYAETTYAALDAITLRGFVRCAKCDVTLITAWQRVALILSGEIYVKLTLPDPPPIEVLRAYVRSHARTASAREKRQALNRVRALRTYLDAVEHELGTRVGEVQKGVDAKLSHD